MKLISFVLILFSLTELVYCQNDTIKASYNGNSDIREYVQRNVVFPPYAVENGIDGTVIYSFKVTKEGCVDSVLFKKTPHKSFNKEIQKVLLNTNCKWKPAYINGKPVDIWIDSKAVFIVQ
jgi:outer membrane biosynthesis protein TonB